MSLADRRPAVVTNFRRPAHTHDTLPGGSFCVDYDEKREGVTGKAVRGHEPHPHRGALGRFSEADGHRSGAGRAGQGTRGMNGLLVIPTTKK